MEKIFSKKKLVVAILLFVFLIITIIGFLQGTSIDMIADASTYNFAGMGTEEDPFQINSVNNYTDFINVINNKASVPSSKGGGNYSDSDKHFKITNNIDLLNTKIVPIVEFGGTFDGGDYVVSNLKISGLRDECAMFFTLTESAVIKNVNYTNTEVSNDFEHSVNIALVAINNYGNISNLIFDGTVNVKGHASVGMEQVVISAGIAINNYGTIDDVSIQGEGEIYCRTDGSDDSNKVAGIAWENSGTISNSYFNFTYIGLKSYIWDESTQNVFAIVGNNTGTKSPSLCPYVSLTCLNLSKSNTNNAPIGLALLSSSILFIISLPALRFKILVSESYFAKYSIIIFSKK